MKIVREDLWKEADVHCVTTNAVFHNGGLVMGAGAARQAVDRYPNIKEEAGDTVVKALKALGTTDLYGFLIVKYPNSVLQQAGLGIFQTKKHWREPSDVNVIYLSACMLAYQALYFPSWKFRLNYPGIGLGGLSIDQVRPIIKTLPDNVTVCMR